MAIVTVTYLQMSSRDQLQPRGCSDSRLTVQEATVKQWQYNRFLYVLVGTPWDWSDKLVWSNEDWQRYAESDTLRTFVAYYDGSPAGYFELNFNVPGDVEIAYFGLAPKFIGKGFGGYLLTRALEIAWETEPQRVWLHTCSKDHPAALTNYQGRGLTVYKVEHIPV